MTSRFLSIVLLAACNGDTPPRDVTTDDFDRSAMLANEAQLMLGLQETFAAKAAVLPGAIDAYCDALDAGAAGATRDAARAAWADAIDAWQAAETVLVGPAAMDNKVLRDRIYAWPLVNACGLDRDTASSWADPASYDVTAQVVNERSLAAIEYSLFTTATGHTCAIEPMGWSSLGADLPRARCRLAHAQAIDVAAAGQVLVTAWRADGGDFGGELTRAGAGSPIPTAQEGINRISDGLFYVDRMVKDMKLGQAAGIADNACGTVQQPCLIEVELPYADRATFAIRINLATLRAVFAGGTGSGFDDFLKARGAPDLADRMVANLDVAIMKAAALPDSFLQALQPANYQKVVETHAAIKNFTDDLKSQFLTVLALEIPEDVAADND